MRALRISAVLLLLALLIGDRAGAVIAGNVIAGRLETAGGLSSTPDVSIRGFPFLTQAVSGRYDRIELSATDVKRRTIGLSRFDVTVKGARVDLGDALGGQVDAVPVEGLTATAVISYAAIASRTGMAAATITRAGREAAVSGTLEVLGQRVQVRSLSTARLVGSTLVISPRTVDLDPKGPELIRAVMPLLELRIDIGTMPYGLRLTGLSIEDDGIELRASSGPTVLQQP